MEWSNISTLTRETLHCNYNFCVHVFVVDTKLNLHTLHRTSRFALQSMNWIARRHHQQELPSIATTCTVEHLANIMSIVLADVPPSHLNKSEDFDSSSSSSSSSESSEEDPSPKKTKQKNKKKLKKTTKKEEKAETRSHHVHTWCPMPGCKAMFCDIRRHLMVHIK